MKGWFYILAGASILAFTQVDDNPNKQTEQLYQATGGGSILLGIGTLIITPRQLNRAVATFNAAQWRKHNSRVR